MFRLPFFLTLALLSTVACSSAEEEERDAKNRDVVVLNEVSTSTGTDIVLDAPDEATASLWPACSEQEPDERFLTFVGDETFHTGPYVMHTTPVSTVIMWESVKKGVGTLEIAPAGDLEAAGESEDFATIARRFDEPEQRRIHGFVVEDLLPNTRYAYRVSMADKVSGIHHVYTAPDPGCAIRYAVWGDSRTYPEACAAVIKSMAPFKPYFNLNVGDVVETGAVLEQWKEQYFDPIRPLGHEVPNYISIGNHEQNVKYYYDRVHFPNPTGLSQDESFYSFTYGNTFFIVLDTNKPYFPVDGKKAPQVLWFEAIIASEEAQAATWRVAFGHLPGYSEGWNPGDCSYAGSDGVRTYILPSLATAGFHAYFAGHTHDYERGFEDGLLQIITGGGGAALDGWCTDFEHVTVATSQYHHIQVTATDEEMRLDAVNTDGEVIDHILLRADKPGVIADEDTPWHR